MPIGILFFYDDFRKYRMLVVVDYLYDNCESRYDFSHYMSNCGNCICSPTQLDENGLLPTTIDPIQYWEMKELNYYP